jgi:hypothetical protein
MDRPRYPLLYQFNTRVYLTALAAKLRRAATLDDIPDTELDHLAATGFDWVWLLSVWQTGLAGQRVSRSNPEWRREFEDTLPDLSEQDIGGSGFAITGYYTHATLGGDEALARLRERLKKRGLRLMLDFVPNHTGLDHPWVEDHPEYYISGTELDLVRAPLNYTWVTRRGGDRLLAYGRDPYFAGWPDTLQLNYGNPVTQDAMLRELLSIAGQCDGVRCDMAMLVLPEVFKRTWRIRAQPFWPMAIRRVRELAPDFCFMAEVYWDLEWTLQQQGFDYTYDKRLYDRLRDLRATPVRDHFRAGLDYQKKLVRFLENHDEARAAAAFPPGPHQAAAVLTYLSPGMRFFHQGQLEGWKKRVSPHLWRGPDEPIDHELKSFYNQLLTTLHAPLLRNGDWQILECSAAWEGNWTCDCMIAFAWNGPEAERWLVVVNYADNQSQCYVRLPYADLGGRTWRLRDRLGKGTYDRDGDNLQFPGLLVDLGRWQYHLFELSALY